ncbi:MAG: aspartate carbamoyltransferase regulatory subunit [Eubacterium sp.]|nr:aspartate carbamoyltransferase regulatory subunit [Eubacterium sp.]
MINVDQINNGFVLDHIQAGRAMAIYHYLELDKLDCQIAIIKNARSSKMGKKDIIKVEGSLDIVDFDIIGFIDHNITVDIIKDGVLVEKRELKLPEKITNVLHCNNPRCITSIEKELPHIFVLTDKKNGLYSCQYCEEKQGRLWEKIKK